MQYRDVNSLFAFSRLGILFYRAANWSGLVNFLSYELRAAKKVGEVSILNEAYVLWFS